MDEKISDTINNICTILGGALILYPLIDQATKTIMPEMQKLQSGEAVKSLKMLPEEKGKHDISETKDSSEYEEERKKHDDERKTKDDEIEMLKKKLAEYESKPDEQESEK